MCVDFCCAQLLRASAQTAAGSFAARHAAFGCGARTGPDKRATDGELGTMFGSGRWFREEIPWARRRASIGTWEEISGDANNLDIGTLRKHGAVLWDGF